MGRPMRIVLVADTFPPLRTSGAVQLRDLAREFVRQGHDLTVLLPASEQREPWVAEQHEGATVIRLRAPRTKDIGYFRRTLGELLMPFAMMRHLRRTPVAEVKWDGVVWYAPSIFFGPIASYLKGRSGCRGYLIVRDIFPEWAVDMGLMGRGLPYRVFKTIASYQYSVANVIGVQTPGNQGYFSRWALGADRRLEVLQNWLDAPGQKPCTIRVADTGLAGRKVFVYAGNMGVAQGMDIMLDLAERLATRSDVGFLFVGRGSDARRLADLAQRRDMSNVVFFDEIDPDEIPDLYTQCRVGLVALDPRHQSHNIPGKFLTYMQSGLPVLANINVGNDLADVVRRANVGQVCESNSPDELHRLAVALLDQLDSDVAIQERCRQLFASKFAVSTAVGQITHALRAA